MTGVNIFTGYKQEEDRFTNGLIAILNLGRCGNPDFVSRFIQTLIGIDGSETRHFPRGTKMSPHGNGMKFGLGCDW